VKRIRAVVIILALAVSAVMTFITLANGFTIQATLPIISSSLPPTPTPIPSPDFPPGTEFRGIWVTRFNWAACCKDDPAKIPDRIQEMVDNIAYAGFNVIYFQVRGEADAFYRSNYEPWSEILTGQLGQDPGVDPLQLMIDKAHAKNIQVHAYINTYPVWLGCDLPAENTSPQHFYYTLKDHHQTTENKLNGLQWNKNGEVICSGDYQRATPASAFVDQHMLNVVEDILSHYQIDGLHLDHIRYAGGASCDPVSREVSGVDCFNGIPENYASYEDWQRAQVNGTVKKLYDLVKSYGSRLWLSAAVWPTYVNYWGFRTSKGYLYSEGYTTYFQDSKAWMKGGYIDSISPMLYSGTDRDPATGNFRQERWYALVENFQNDRGSGLVLPGIGTNHYSSFTEIEARINMARSLGTAGHIIFSYGGLEQLDYFDDLRDGPYAQPAAVPPVTSAP
jgi:uncharacterized lipoprotein YddW (UPF0748 family)